jgi:hypothetical protein
MREQWIKSGHPPATVPLDTHHFLLDFSLLTGFKAQMVLQNLSPSPEAREMCTPSTLQIKCNCPYAEKGNQCKHIVWVLVRVLRARTDLQYQLGLLNSELREIFENAPRIDTSGNGEELAAKSEEGNRKSVDGDCPICFTEFEGKETVVFCKAACGNNFHSDCLKHWAATKRQAGVKVTCPLCRTPWDNGGGSVPVEHIKSAVEAGSVNEEGYVNVAGELGISRDRGMCLN